MCKHMYNITTFYKLFFFFWLSHRIREKSIVAVALHLTPLAASPHPNTTVTATRQQPLSSAKTAEPPSKLPSLASCHSNNAAPRTPLPHPRPTRSLSFQTRQISSPTLRLSRPPRSQVHAHPGKGLRAVPSHTHSQPRQVLH